MYLLFVVVISILTSIQSGPAPIEKPWVENYIEARKTALELNRPYIIFFTSDNCSSCDVQRTIFNRPAIQSIMNQSFIGLDVNIQNFDGATLKKYYRVENLPTLIFFSPSGDVLYHYDRILSEKQLTRALLRPKENVFPQAPSQTNLSKEKAHIQMGVFSREEGARDLRDRLTRICLLSPNLIKEGSHYKVVFSDLERQEIKELKNRLDTYGYSYQLIEDP